VAPDRGEGERKHPRRLPPGWVPPDTDWSAVFDEGGDFVFAQLGIQSREGSEPASEVAAALNLLGGADAPIHVIRAVHLDAAGARNDIVMAYWRASDVYRRWRERRDVVDWWSAPPGQGGRWLEALTIPLDRFESIHAQPRDESGVERLTGRRVTDEHGYWGAMRDRIDASAQSDLDGLDELRPGAFRSRPLDGRPGAVRVESEAGLCFIRTAQDWLHTTGDERRRYLDEVRPVLRVGAGYLRDHPVETGCISGRFVEELELDGGATDRTCFLGWFASLAHLERWSESHPTHLAIFDQFKILIGTGEMRLRLWHEVSVLPAGGVELTYVNCHSQTGFLAWAAPASSSNRLPESSSSAR
jgi:aldoxime dehydratase